MSTKISLKKAKPKPTYPINPDLIEESKLGFFLGKTIIGVDEVGRGCLAGPVVAAGAVLSFQKTLDLGFSKKGVRPRLSKSSPLLSVRDSKLIPESERAPLAEHVKKFVIASAVAEASVTEIEDINILKASHLAMERAVNQVELTIGKRADWILVDGNLIPTGLKDRGVPLVKGDLRSLTIACASIVAKVYRDELMLNLESQYPGYGLAQHKGYPTPFHKKQILLHGVTDIHRKTFKGVCSDV